MNDLSDALKELASAIIKVAAALATEEPKEEVPWEEEKPEKKSEAAKKREKPKEKITIEQVRAVMAEKSQAGLTTKVRELIKKFGADKLSGVDPEKYPELMKCVQELS